MYLLEREDQGWDASPNWEDILSLGEQQRLGMVSLGDFTFHCILAPLPFCCHKFIRFCLPQARLFFHHPKFGILDECTKYEFVMKLSQLFLLNNVVDNFVAWLSYYLFTLLYSATSVDVEEHLYQLATEMGITFITSSQVNISKFQFYFSTVYFLVTICTNNECSG